MYIMLMPNCNIPTEQYLYGILFAQKLIVMENISLEMGIIGYVVDDSEQIINFSVI